MHKSVEVNIGTEEQTVIACSKCPYKCKLNIQLKKHMKKHHTEDPKYKCTECEFTANFTASTWEHTLSAHPDKSFNFSPKETENLIPELLELMGRLNKAIHLEDRDSMILTEPRFIEAIVLLQKLLTSGFKDFWQ